MAPSHASVVREGAGEALTGVRAGWAIEPRNQGDRGADVVKRGGRQHRRQRYRELPADPARSKNLCMHGISMRENREIPRSPAQVDGGAGRSGKAKAARLRCTSTGSQTAPYYLRSRRTTPVRRRRRWWREGGWPRGTRTSKTRPGRSAGQGAPSALDRVRRSRTEGQGRAVHGAPAPRRPRPSPGGLLGCQPAGRHRGGRGDVADLRPGPGGQSPGSAPQGRTRGVPGEAVSQELHPEGGRAASAARYRRARGQDRPARRRRGAEQPSTRRTSSASLTGFGLGAASITRWMRSPPGSSRRG